MTDDKSKKALKSFRSLRQRAESLLNTQADKYPQLATKDVQALVHELSVHQTELEIQNEELRQAQLKLADARDQYLELYDFAPFGYVTLAADGTIVAANLMAATMLGRERCKLQGENFAKFLTRKAADDFHRHKLEAFSSDSKITCEIELDKGDHLPVVIRLESIAYGPPSDRYCRCAMIDITTLKTAEKNIRDREEQLKQLNITLEQRVAEQTQEIRLLAEAVSHLGEGVLITADDLEWPGPKIIFVNEAMCRITGYRKDELTGQSPRILQGMDTDGATLRRIKFELQDGNSSSAELINYRKDGTPYYAELFVTPLLNTEGQRTHFVSIHRDITERKRAEEALRRSHAYLEQRVKERTFELEQANKESIRANAEKSRFLTAVSHDLRQPLQAIELYLSVLAPQLKLQEQRELYEKIRKPLFSMAEILNLLLDISKLQSGTMNPSRKAFSVHSILNRIIANNRLQATEKGLHLECSKTDCVVYSDPVLLERAIENLVSNAIRYTDEGIVKIACENNMNSALITVSDTGIGIAEKDLDVIFESYYQLDNPMRDRNKGFGLGLSIVKLICELLNHSLKVSSEPGKGSTFAIQVPQVQREVQVPELDTSLVSNEICNGEGTVLVVDDNEVISDALAMSLKSAGYKVYNATNADEALKWIVDGTLPDAIICDYRLPGGCGFDTIVRIRKAMDTTIPALLFTGDISNKEIETRKLPNCTVLQKALETETLLSWVRKYVGIDTDSLP